MSVVGDILVHFVPLTVPDRVREIEVSVVGRERLNISWEETLEPNDFTWNYTVSVTDNITGTEVFSSKLPMNETQIIDEPFQKLGMCNCCSYSLYSLSNVCR